MHVRFLRHAVTACRWVAWLRFGNNKMAVSASCSCYFLESPFKLVKEETLP